MEMKTATNTELQQYVTAGDAQLRSSYEAFL